jgi:predicted small metal-binding protein
MQLACEEVVPDLGCEFVAIGDTVDEVHATMMEHGGATHSNLMEGKTPAEMEQAGAEMAAHIRQLLENR